MFGKKFQKLLLKNTFAIVAPAIAVFLVLSFLLLRYPVFDRIESYDISGVADYNGKLQLMYDTDTTLVEYQTENLYYTGYDYYIDGKLKGAYYYNLDSKYMNFFIIKTDNPKLFIAEHKVKGKIIEDNISVKHIAEKMASATGLSEDMVENYYSQLVISEIDYPTAYIVLVYVLCLSPVIACGLIILYTLLIIINPAMHSQSEQLANYGNIKYVIKDLNRELRRNLVYKRNNVYITDNYIVISHFLKTEVVKLDMIKYLSKNIVDKKVGIGKTEEVYRITMSNPGILFYEVDFYDEEFVDQVVAHIRGVYPS